MTELVQHLDNILKASGSGLKNYSMQKTLNDMRNALKAAIAAEREACAKIVQTHLDANDDLRTKGSLASVLDYIKFRGEQS
jgi:hypothetical protein